MSSSRARSVMIGLALAATVLVTASCASGAATSGTAQPAGLVAASTPTATATAKPTPKPTPKPTVKPTPKPVVVVTNVDVTEPIPFAAVSVDDANLDVGQNVVSTSGINGTKVTTWAVTTVDGVETGRTVVSVTTSVAPVDQVTLVGTRVPPPPAPAPEPEPAPVADGGGCDPNYSSPCVPIASDVDCAGGSGNGPAYVAGPVYVVGVDIYDLDSNNDGVACV